MSRPRSTWPEVVALILRDCEPEARLEFMRALGVWKRTSTRTMDESKHEEDRLAAETRMVRLCALEEHLQRELDFSESMRLMAQSLYRGMR